jgi:hypothetical protein
MKALEKLNKSLFLSLEQDKTANLQALYGGKETSRDSDTKVSDQCDVVGTKKDDGCCMVGERDYVKTDCTDDTPEPPKKDGYGLGGDDTLADTAVASYYAGGDYLMAIQ